jgi:hypothetical protein
MKIALCFMFDLLGVNFVFIINKVLNINTE